MKRNKIVLKVSKGIIFRMQEEKEGVIEAIHESNASVYNYQNPYIPDGFKHVKGKWKKGFTIRNKEDGSEFTWIPVGFIEPDGTLDGQNFNERFGRRVFRGKSLFSAYRDEVNQEMIESIKTYGGLYFSSYVASKEKGKLVFKKGNSPWVLENHEAKVAAEYYSVEYPEIVTCLPSGSAYDTVLKWIIQIGEKTFDEVVKDSKSWGNYRDNPDYQSKIMPTGSKKTWCVCNIYDLAGNCGEWSSELVVDNMCGIMRSGHCTCYGKDWSASRLIESGLDNCASFRSVLYKKP